jgi:NADH:ubiquinone oxidoreductase subunit D
MSTKIVSEVQTIPHMVGDVYGFFSDFRKIAKVFELAASNPQVQEQIEAQTKKKLNIKDHIEHWEATEDNCTFVIKGFGEAGLQFVEKEENKTLKLTGYGRSPFEFYLWIQLIEKGPYDTRIRLTVHAELNAMMKMMLKKKLEKGINQLAEGLTQIPYSALQNME